MSIAHSSASIVAIDPGKKTGVAVYEGDTLARLFTTTHAGAIDAIVKHRPLIVAVERPYVYPGGRTPDPNVIVDLAVDTGELLGRARAIGAQGWPVAPGEWGGRVPKKVRAARSLRFAQACGWDIPNRTSEHARDALGVLIWALACLERRGGE